MAINLWEAGGKPTSYNPLPSSAFVNNIPLYKNYVITFSAKSASSAVLRVTSVDGVSDFNQLITLTENSKEYSFSWLEIEGGKFYFIDNASRGDIIIQDINIVEKPMAVVKLTKKNLFNDKAARLINNYAANTYYNFLIKGSKPNTRYTMSHTGGSGFGKGFYWALSTNVGYVPGEMAFAAHATDTFSNYNSVSITTKSDGKLYISLTCLIGMSQAELDRFFVELGITIQVEEGGAKTIYEPYVEFNPPAVKSVPKKNLIKTDALSWENGIYSPVGGSKENSTTRLRSIYKTPVKPNSTYIVSFNPGYQFVVQRYSTSSATPIADSAWQNSGYLVYTDANTSFLLFHFKFSNDVDILPNELVKIQPQVEEGTTATPYEPYKLVNSKSVRVENIFDKAMEWGYINPSGGAPTASVSHKRNINFMPIKPLTNFVLISNKINNWYVHFYDQSQNIISSFQSIGKNKVVYDSTNTPTNTRFVKFHFDDTGSSGVNYELHQFYEENKSISSPSTKGVIMDGVTNYVQLPSMTMDSVEIDCLVSSANSSSVLIDARGGLANGYMYHTGFLGVGFQTRHVDGVVGGVVTSNKRTVLMATSNAPLSDNINIFSNNSTVEKTIGILYGVKCYLNGKVVAEYDFTKENAKANAVLFGQKTWGIKQAKR